MFRKSRYIGLSLLLLLISLSLLTLASCGGGGGGASGPTTINYSNPDEAASAASDAGGTVALVQVMSGMASSIAVDGAAQGGYNAPSKRKAANANAIASIDPRLKTLVDKMVSQIQTPVVKNAMIKARAAKPAQKTVSLTTDCDNVGTGSLAIIGTDNLDVVDRTYDEATVTITFTTCRDNTMFTETSGKMQLNWKKMLDGSSTVANVKVTNFVQTLYTSVFFTTVIERATMNGTFNSTDNLTSGTDYANGSFTFADASGSGTFFFTGLSDNWSSITDVDGNQIDAITVNGSFGFSFSDSFNTISLTFTLSNLRDKWRYNTDGTVDHWLNGSIIIVWSPAVCRSGIITFTTADATPMHYLTISDTCPVSGTLKVNNATIVFGSPITVTVGGTTWNYTDCYDMEMAGSGMCQ